MSSIIEIKDLKRDFALGNQIVKVLKGINLSIEKNEYVALMGPSGSGKSTLMNLIGCLDTPTSGTYVLNNKDVSQLTDNELAEIRNQEIGFIFQRFNLIDHLTVMENVVLPLILTGSDNNIARIIAKRLLKEVELEGIEDKLASELSGGQRQRVALGRSIVRNAK